MDRLTALLAATAVALGATALWFAQQSANEHDRASALAARLTALESALAEAHRVATPKLTRLADSDVAPTAATVEPPVPHTATLSDRLGTTLVQYRESEAHRLRSPQYRERWLAMKTLQRRQTYADLQQVLGLSDAEFDAFLATMTQFELEQTLQNLEAPLDRELTRDQRRAASRQLAAQAEAARRQALRNALGDTRYRQWADHQRLVPARHELTRWQTELAQAGTPLTPSQSQSLLPILVEQQQRIAALPDPAALAGQAAATRPPDQTPALEQRIDAQADINAWFGDALSAVLTPQQREHVTAVGLRELELQRSQLELDRARFADQGGP
jgi:hypothetical protein